MKLETKVGVFFTASIALLGVLIFRMEKLDLFGKRDNRLLVTEFGQVAGLNLQSPVRVAGVKVGEVRRIELQNGRAVVYFSLPEGFKVYGDAAVSLSSIGILGEKYVDLDPGHFATGPHADSQSIASKTGVSLDNLMETLGAIGTDVKGITYALNRSIGGDEGRQKLDEIVDNIRTLTAEFRAMSQENHAAINNTMANVEAISGDLRERLPRLAQQFEDLGRNLNGVIAENRPEFKSLMGDVRRLAQGFQGTSENIRSITDKMNRGEGTIGKLLNDETTVKKINTAVDNVNELMGGLKNMELRLDMNGARWDKRNDSKTGLSIDIIPRPDYWYSLALNSTPDGKVSDSTHTVIQIDPLTGKEKQVLETTRSINTDQAFTVSAQFAKRLGDHFVLSGGLVESKGGGGLEFRSLEDRLRLGILAYDFSKREGKDNPRYRFTTSYQFWKGLYVQAGWQDIANRDLRTFFFGGGIRWKDDDIKKLVGLAGAAK